MIRPTLYPTPVPAWDPVAEYERHQPEKTLLHEVVREQLEGFLANSFYRDQAAPRFVEHELRSFLRCGVLAHGLLRLHCDDCGHDNVGHARTVLGAVPGTTRLRAFPASPASRAPLVRQRSVDVLPVAGVVVPAACRVGAAVHVEGLAREIAR